VGSFIKFIFKAAIWLAVIALVIAGILRVAFVDVAQVGHNAMAPTLIFGDQVLAWRGSTPELGDIAICEHPGRLGELVMGRVVATSGMLVEQERGTLIVEGTREAVDWEEQVRFLDAATDEDREYRTGIAKRGNTEHRLFVPVRGRADVRTHRVAEGRIYLLGDNRGHVGMDSRYFGDVDPSTCTGQVFMRLLAGDDGGAGLGHRPLDILN